MMSRRFGYMTLIEAGKLDEHPLFLGLGRRAAKRGPDCAISSPRAAEGEQPT